jgi:hypothetical protein
MTDNTHSSNTCYYFCKKCEYTCHDFSNWEKHTNSNKHITNTEAEDIVIERKLCKYSCCKQSVLNKSTNSFKEAWKENGVCYKKKKMEVI